MKTKIVRVRGGTEKEILSKKFNIFIGISLGNKWFTKENLAEYILWALEHTKESVLVLIADKIHAINYQVMLGKSYELSLKRVLKKGDKVENMVKKILDEMKATNVSIIRWDELEKLDFIKKSQKLFFQKFKEDKNFKEEIIDVVESSFSRKFTRNELEQLSEYVLRELPIMISEFEYGSMKYGCYPYPLNTKVAEFVEKIQKQEIFGEIKDELKFNNMVCVQLELEK